MLTIDSRMMPTVRKGDRNESVKTLQRSLNLYPDGIFGPLTEEGVIAFQKANGLKVDGIVGPKTWEKFLSLRDKEKEKGEEDSSLGITLVKSKRTIKELIVHCTASLEGQDCTVEQIRKMHTDPVSKKGRGWSDIGYHYVIYRDGSIHPGRDINISGAHCTGHNLISLGIVYVGGCGKSDSEPKDTRTPAQKESLLKLLKGLKRLYPNATIHGHNEFAAKACPSFNAKAEYSGL